MGNCPYTRFFWFRKHLGRPCFIIITGSDGASATNMDVDYTITAKATGLFSFHWNYHTNDQAEDPSWDPAGVIINGSFTQLTDDVGTVDQSGTFSASVTAGTTIGFKVRATDNLAGTATFTVSSFSPPGGVLPIILTSFTGQKQNNAVQLDWSSSVETNFSHFVVERSGNATNFSPLQTVKANATHHYDLIDEHPLPGRNFYRLKMVDNDSTATYSNTVAVNMPELAQSVAVWPNPAKEDCKIHITAALPYIETIIISTAAGTNLVEQNITLQQGANEKEIRSASLAKGIYFVHLKKAGITIQLLKQ